MCRLHGQTKRAHFAKKAVTNSSRVILVCLQFSLEEINMNLTLEENGIKDGLSVEEMGLTTSYCPVLCLYWCDDLTIA